MEHILEHRKKITEQLVKSYSGEESTTGAPKFIVISHSLAGCTTLTTILNALEKSQSGEALSIFVDNNIDESKHQISSQIDSIVLKGFSVEQLLIIKEDTKGKLEKSYIPELIDLIKADDNEIEEKYKKKIAALKERRDPEGIEKSDEKEEAKDHDEEGNDAPEMKSEVQKSQELTIGEIERQRVANNLQKAYTPIFEDPDYLEKGKKAEIGEIRTWGGIKYVKHQDGWVTFNQNTGKGSVYGSDGKKKMDAGEHHVNHFKEKTNEPGVLGKPDTISLDKDHREGSFQGYRLYDKIFYNYKGEKIPGVVADVFEDGLHIVLDKKIKWLDKKAEKRDQGVYNHLTYRNEHLINSFDISNDEGDEFHIKDLSKRESDSSKDKEKETTKKPTLEEVDTAFSKVGKALAEGRDPDAISSLRDEAKKLGAAYGMSNEKIDEAISTSKKAHQDEHNQSTEDKKKTPNKESKAPETSPTTLFEVPKSVSGADEFRELAFQLRAKLFKGPGVYEESNSGYDYKNGIRTHMVTIRPSKDNLGATSIEKYIDTPTKERIKLLGGDFSKFAVSLRLVGTETFSEGKQIKSIKPQIVIRGHNDGWIFNLPTKKGDSDPVVSSIISPKTADDLVAKAIWDLRYNKSKHVDYKEDREAVRHIGIGSAASSKQTTNYQGKIDMTAYIDKFGQEDLEKRLNSNYMWNPGGVRGGKKYKIENKHIIYTDSHTDTYD